MDKHWFDCKRFGFFIHWGVYAGAFGNEWVKSDLKMTDEQYRKYLDFFEPDLFDPHKWAEAARNAGMEYVVFTAKHHDGFCLFDTLCTDYNSVRLCGRDFLREVVDAFRGAGFRIGIYYSLPDWHHPDYVIDARHPLRDKPEPRNSGGYTGFLHRQVRELLTNYGPIDILWFDGSYPDTRHIWDAPRLAALIRSLQPEILIARLPGFDDFATPEQTIPGDSLRAHRWEGCQVINGQWGYTTVNQHWRSAGMLVKLLVEHVSRGGNLLLNAGPTGRGALDDRTLGLLAEIGGWMRLHRRSIVNCTAAPPEFPAPENCRYTWNPDTGRLYLHCFSWHLKQVSLGNLAGRIAYARFLHDHSEIPLKQHDGKNRHAVDASPGSAVLSLPIEPPEVLLPVIELILKPGAAASVAGGE